MTFFIFIGAIVVLATFVAILMFDPTDPYYAGSAAEPQATPKPKLATTGNLVRPTVPANPVATARPGRTDPAFYEHIGRRPVVIPELDQPVSHSPYIVDLSKQDALKK